MSASSEKAPELTSGVHPVNRRTALRIFGGTSLALALGGGGAGLGWWQRGKYDQDRAAQELADRERYLTSAKFVELQWREQPALSRSQVEIIKLAGDPRAAGRDIRQREHVGLVGIRESSLKAQMGSWHRVGVALWAPSEQDKNKVVAHVGDLGSRENMGVVDWRVQTGLDGIESQENVLLAGFPIGPESTDVSLVVLDNQNNAVPLHDLMAFKPLDVVQVGQQHPDIPIVM